MSLINPVGEMTSRYASMTSDPIKTLDERASSENEVNVGFLMMYETWKQEILLSDGLTENDNIEW